MRSWSVAAVVLLAAWAAGCGGNSTPVGVTVAPNPATVLLNSSLQFVSNVSGASATTVTWQVCLPPTSSSSTTPPPPTTMPTDCTPIPGVATPKGGTVLTGYGTIQQNGLYTAPPALPTPNTAVILVTSTVDATAFAMASLTIESGIRVQVTPPTATIGPLESFQFTATVKGPTNNTGVSWTLSLAGNNNPPALGTITPAGLYTAPGTSPGVVTVTATSAADPTQSGSAASQHLVRRSADAHERRPRRGRAGFGATGRLSNWNEFREYESGCRDGSESIADRAAGKLRLFPEHDIAPRHASGERAFGSRIGLDSDTEPDDSCERLRSAAVECVPGCAGTDCRFARERVAKLGERERGP